LFCHRRCFGCIASPSLLANNLHNPWNNRSYSDHHGLLLHS
jgi:hypothetical protein